MCVCVRVCVRACVCECRRACVCEETEKRGGGRDREVAKVQGRERKKGRVLDNSTLLKKLKSNGYVSAINFLKCTHKHKK